MIVGRAGASAATRKAYKFDGVRTLLPRTCLMSYGLGKMCNGVEQSEELKLSWS